MEVLNLSKSRKEKSHLTKEIVNKVYGAGACSYDEIMDKGWRSLINRQKVLSGLRLSNSYIYNLLEIGVGTGLNIPYYPNNINLTAIDFTKEMLNEARIKRSSDFVEFLEMNAEKMSFETASFDHALSTLVISAAPNPEDLIREAWRVTKPGGRFSILDVCKSPLSEVANIQEQLILPYSTTSGFPAPNGEIPNGVIVYQPNRDILEMVKRAGWGITDYEYLNTENPFTCRIYINAIKE